MINDQSTITVSIVTFNNIKIVEERLNVLLPIFKDSCVSQVIMVDNNSTDGTDLVLKKIESTEKILKVIALKENKGFGFGHNQAIRDVNSQYHVVMNLDTTPNSTCLLRKMASYMDENPSIDLLSPLVRFPNGDIQLLTRNEPTIFDLGIRLLGQKWFKKRQAKFVNLDNGYDHEQPILNATGSFMFFKTHALHAIGGFDERYFLYMEDTDLTKSINQMGNAIFSPQFEVVHEWQRGNHSFKGSKLMIISMVKYFNKWGWRLF